MADVILKDFRKIKDGKYLKNYELYYTNKVGKDKTYEIVSYNDITDISQIGKSVNGVVLVALCKEQLLLLKEFRMGVNRFVYNLCEKCRGGDYSPLTAAMPGSTLPSMASSRAPPPVEM